VLATDKVRIVDGLLDDMFVMALRDIGPGWDCRVGPRTAGPGSFTPGAVISGSVISCDLVDKSKLTQDFGTVLVYEACDARRRGLVENVVRILLNDEFQDIGSTVADVPECDDLQPIVLPVCTDRGADSDSFASFLPEVTRALTTGDLEFFRANAMDGFSMKGPANFQGRGIEEFIVHLRDWSAASRPALTDEFGDGSLRVHAFARNGDVVHTLVTSIVEHDGENERVGTVLTWREGGTGAVGPNVPFFPGAWVMINELLFNDDLPLPPLTWLCAPPAPADTPMPSMPPETVTPVVISPPSTGEGSDLGASPVVPLRVVAAVAGMGLVAW